MQQRPQFPPKRHRTVMEKPAEDFDPLTAYTKDLGQCELMSASVELAKAKEIVELRGRLWIAFFSYPPHVAPICDLVSETLPGDAVKEMTRDLNRVAAMSEKLRAGGNRTSRKFEAVVAALAERLAFADTDGLVSKMVMQDLERLGARELPVRLSARLPPRDSARYTDHVGKARRIVGELEMAVHAFTTANLRLVVTLARRFNHGQMPLHDLIQEGNLGLMKAVDRFDYRKGFRFSTYASWWIRHTISRAISDKSKTVRIPVDVGDAQAKIAREGRKFSMEHGRAPTRAELATRTGLTERKVELALADQHMTVSLDTPSEHDATVTLANTIEDTSIADPVEWIDGPRRIAVLLSLMEKALTPMQLDILRQRMGFGGEEEKTLKEVGESYGVSRERIRQIQEEALAKLRSEMRRRGL